MKYKIGRNKVVSVKSANKARGFLLDSINGLKFFRIYNEKDKHKFQDFAVYHSDIELEICDIDVYFYEDEHGNSWLDYSPEALGLKKYVEGE